MRNAPCGASKNPVAPKALGCSRSLGAWPDLFSRDETSMMVGYPARLNALGGTLSVRLPGCVVRDAGPIHFYCDVLEHLGGFEPCITPLTNFIRWFLV